MRPFLLMVRLFAAPVFRRRWGLLGSLVSTLAIGFEGSRTEHPWIEALESSVSATRPDACAADLPKVSLSQALLSPLDWPAPWVSPEEAEVQLRVSIPKGCANDASRTCIQATTIRVVSVKNDASVSAVARCLRDRLSVGRDAALEKLGIHARPNAVVTLIEQADNRWGLQKISAILFMNILIVVSSTGMVTLPLTRTSGVLESLLVTGVKRAQLARAAQMVLILSGLVTLCTTLLGTLLSHQFNWDLHLLLLPAVLVATSGGVVATMVGASGMIDANLRLMLPMFGMPLLAVFARWSEHYIGAWSALIPWGGAISIMVDDRPFALLPALGATLVSVGTAFLAQQYVARQFDMDGAVSPESGSLVQRHAAGDYRIEAVLFGIFPLPIMMLLFVSFQKMMNSWSLALVQFGAFALPALLSPLVLHLPFREALSLRWPKPWVWALTPGLVAATTSAGLLGLKLLPTSVFASSGDLDLYTQALSRMPPLVVTAIPGATEELLFRGAVQGLLLRKLHPIAAIALQAALFALAHGQLFKLSPTFAIGCVLGWLAYRSRSVLPGMLVHSLHNALAVGVFGSLFSDQPIFWVGMGFLGLLSLAGVAALTPPARPANF